MKRLIAKKDIDFIKVLSDTVILDDIIITNLINSNVLKLALKNRSLSSGEIIDKILKSKLNKALSSVYQELFANDNIKELLKDYEEKDIIIALRKYLRNNIRNKGFIYKQLNKHLYNIFHSSNDDNDDNIKTKNSPKKIVIDLSDISNIKQLQKCFEEFSNFYEKFKHTIIQVLSEDKDIKQFIYDNRNLDIDDLMDKFNQLDHTNITRLILRIICNHFSTEEKIFIGDDVPSNSPIIKTINNYINNSHIMQSQIVNLFIDMIKNLPINDNLQNNKIKDLRKLTFQEMKNLPTLTQMYKINDNINDIHNISLLNYYSTKIVITIDSVKFFPNTSDQIYINELKNNNTQYAIGTITHDGIVCIHDCNMNIQDMINTCKNNSSQIKKVYILNEQYNLAAQITRKAKLLYMRKDKRNI